MKKRKISSDAYDFKPNYNHYNHLISLGLKVDIYMVLLYYNISTKMYPSFKK